MTRTSRIFCGEYIEDNSLLKIKMIYRQNSGRFRNCRLLSPGWYEAGIEWRASLSSAET